MRKRRVYGLFLALVIVGVAAYFVTEATKQADRQGVISTAPPTTLTAIPTTVPAQEPFSSLAAALPDQLDGYHVDTGAKATGPLDFEAAVKAEADQHSERALLETRHFRAGYGRAFVDQTSEVYMAVYSFRTPSDASLYAADGIINLTGKGAGIYDVSEIVGAKGFSQAIQHDGRPAIVHGVVFAKNERFYLTFTRTAGTSTPGEVAAIASSLAARN